MKSAKTRTLMIAFLLLLLLASCSDMLIQLSNQGSIETQIRWEEEPVLTLSIEQGDGSITIRSETTQSVTYRWYLDGDLLYEEQNAQLILAESSLDVGSHRITVVVQTGIADMQYASAETRFTIGL